MNRRRDAAMEVFVNRVIRRVAAGAMVLACLAMTGCCGWPFWGPGGPGGGGPGGGGPGGGGGGGGHWSQPGR